MRKIILSILAVAAFGTANAQDGNPSSALSEGSWLVEGNTAFGAAHASSTAFSLWSQDGYSSWSLGGEVGYFVMENLAIKAGLGYGSSKYDGSSAISSFSYKIGAKYYIISQIPVQVDFSGASIKDRDENPSYLGLQAGYAWFVAPNVSIEPGLRYNVSLNSDFYEDVLQFNIGFALHF